MRDIINDWKIVPGVVEMFVMSIEDYSNAESSVVKAVIDNVTTDETMLVSVASDTENMAKKLTGLYLGKKTTLDSSLMSCTSLSITFLNSCK